MDAEQADRNVDAVRITREWLDKLERAEEALMHVAAERDRLRSIVDRVHAVADGFLIGYGDCNEGQREAARAILDEP